MEPSQTRLVIDATEARLAAGNEGEIAGYGSVFAIKDWHKSSVAPGAFAASLADWQRKRRTPPMLWMHHVDEPIGAWESLAEDARGLRLKGRINLDTAKGREAWSLVRQKAVSGLSIGVNVIEDEHDRQNDIRVLKKVDLVEVSIVSIPSNPEAHIETRRFETRSAYEQFLRQHGVAKAAARKLATGGWPALLKPEPQHDPALAKLLARIDAAAAETRTGRYRKG